MAMTWPVIQLAWAPTRSAAMPATSSASPTRPRGCIDSDAAQGRRVVDQPTSDPRADESGGQRIDADAARRVRGRSRDDEAVDTTLGCGDGVVVDQTDPSRRRREEERGRRLLAWHDSDEGAQGKEGRGEVGRDDLLERLVADGVGGSEQRRADSVHQGCWRSEPRHDLREGRVQRRRRSCVGLQRERAGSQC